MVAGVSVADPLLIVPVPVRLTDSVVPWRKRSSVARRIVAASPTRGANFTSIVQDAPPARGPLQVVAVTAKSLKSLPLIDALAARLSGGLVRFMAVIRKLELEEPTGVAPKSRPEVSKVTALPNTSKIIAPFGRLPRNWSA